MDNNFKKEIPRDNLNLNNNISPMLSVPMFKYFSTASSKHAMTYNDGFGEATTVTKDAPPRKEMDISKFAAPKVITCLM